MNFNFLACKRLLFAHSLKFNVNSLLVSLSYIVMCLFPHRGCSNTSAKVSGLFVMLDFAYANTMSL